MRKALIITFGLIIAICIGFLNINFPSVGNIFINICIWKCFILNLIKKAVDENDI